MSHLKLREGCEVQVDPGLIPFLQRFSPKSWYFLSKAVKLRPVGPEQQLVDRRRLVTLNRLVWWQSHGNWPDAKTLLFHLNGDPMDFRLENLGTRSSSQLPASIEQNRTPASELKGIYPQRRTSTYEVRAYDSVAKTVVRLGYTRSLEDGIALKRAFLNGDPAVIAGVRKRTPSRPKKDIMIKLPAKLKTKDVHTLQQFTDEQLVNELWQRLFGTSVDEQSTRALLKRRIWGMMNRFRQAEAHKKGEVVDQRMGRSRP